MKTCNGPEECRSGIYCIRHDVDGGRIYIGSSVSLKARWKSHRTQLRQGKHHSAHLQRAWIKYGEVAFVFEVLEYVPNVAELVVREQSWIDVAGAINPLTGFNMCPIAGSALGVKHTDATKAKIRAAKLGIPHSPETRLAMSAALMGRTPTPETREKLRMAGLGKVPSPAHRAALSAAHIGKPITTPRHAGAKANMSAAQKSSEKARRRHEALIESHKGSKRSAETKAAISAGIKAWWANRKRPDEARSIRRAA